MMYVTPMYAKVAIHGTSFHDQDSGLRFYAHKATLITELTPTIQTRLQNGGLVPCTEDGHPLHPRLMSQRRPSGMIGTGSPARDKAKQKTEEMKTIAMHPPAVEATPDTGVGVGSEVVDAESTDDGEKGLEDLLNEATPKTGGKGKTKPKKS